MKAYLRYFAYICRHKYFVFVAGLKIRASLWLLLIHDWSKFLPDEFFPYARYFYTEKKDREDFNRAWLLHQRRNPHHWQYWYLVQDSDLPARVVMPEKYVREMVADWAGAGRAITGRWSVSEWYEANKYTIKLHPETRRLAERLIMELSK